AVRRDVRIFLRAAGGELLFPRCIACRGERGFAVAAVDQLHDSHDHYCFFRIGGLRGIRSRGAHDRGGIFHRVRRADAGTSPGLRHRRARPGAALPGEEVHARTEGGEGGRVVAAVMWRAGDNRAIRPFSFARQPSLRYNTFSTVHGLYPHDAEGHWRTSEHHPNRRSLPKSYRFIPARKETPARTYRVLDCLRLRHRPPRRRSWNRYRAGWRFPRADDTTLREHDVGCH